MEILVVVDKVPTFQISAKKTTTIGSLKSLLEKYQDSKIQMFLNNKTELKVFDSNKYDNMTLASAWKKMKKPSISVRTKAETDYQKFLTGQKDADLLILSRLDDKSLLNVCVVNKEANELCKDEDFWRNRFVKKFGKIAAGYKPDGRSWRNHYLKVISDLDTHSNDPWKFFKEVSWLTSDSDLEKVADLGSERAKKIGRDPEEYHNLFWMLDLGKEVKIAFPVDRYQELDPIERTYYNSETNFTPGKVLKLIYDFYQEYITEEELEEQQEVDNPYAEDYYDLDIGSVRRIDMMGDLKFFEGFSEYPQDEPGLHYLQLGT